MRSLRERPGVGWFVGWPEGSERRSSSQVVEVDGVSKADVGAGTAGGIGAEGVMGQSGESERKSDKEQWNRDGVQAWG